MEFIPKYIKRTEDKRASEVITNEDWNQLFNLIINQGDWNTKALVDLCKELELYSNTAQIIEMINEKVKEIGSADMTQQDYDTNSDGIVNKADTVVDGGIQTSSIQDGAITEIKLENIIKSKLNYCYSKVGLLLILVSAQNEITGSENLDVFGLDGTLETGYNIESETTNLLLNPVGYYTGSFTINHYAQDASSLLKTNKKYTLTNNSDLANVKLTQIVNAAFTTNNTNSKIITLPQYLSGSTNYRRDELRHGYVVHIQNNFYYVVITADYERTKSDTFHECIFVYPTTFDGNTVSVGTPIELSLSSFDSIYAIGEYMFIMATEDYQKDGQSDIYIFDSNGNYKSFWYYNDSEEKNTDFNFASNGNVYWSSYWREDDEVSLYKYTFATGQQTELLTMEDVTSTSAVSISTITGRWGTVRTKDWDGVYEYYILDLHSGALTKIEKNSDVYNNVYLENGSVRDIDGMHYYKNGNKYRIDESGTVSVYVDTIKNGNIINNLRSYEDWIHNNMFIDNEQVYSIINKNCLPVYPTKRVNSWSSGRSASMGIKSLTEGLCLETVEGDIYSLRLVPYSFTEGSITLETALDKNMLGELYIKRQHECTILTGQTKQIYLKPTLKNTFNAVNLIVYLSRELKADDTLTIDINGNILTPLAASTSTTKYYELALGTATSDFEVVVTMKAGSTGTMHLTQILGGVDNAV